MAEYAKRAFFEEPLPTGNRLVKKCPLMTSHERKYHCLHICEALVLLECFIGSKMLQSFRSEPFLFMDKKRERDFPVALIISHFLYNIFFINILLLSHSIYKHRCILRPFISL